MGLAYLTKQSAVCGDQCLLHCAIDDRPRPDQCGREHRLGVSSAARHGIVARFRAMKQITKRS